MTIGDVTAVPWVLAEDSDNTRTVQASVSADLAVHTVLAGSEPRHVERINHGGALPDLLRMKVGLYLAETAGPAHRALAEMLRQSFAGQRARGLSIAAA